MNQHSNETESTVEENIESSTLFSVSENDYSSYNCKYCLYGTNTIKALRRHERAHIIPGPSARKELKPLHCCEFCNSKFVQKKDLEEHRKSHAVGMVCSLCSYSSANKNILKNHVRAHNNKRSFQCLLCTERMTNQKMFDTHMNKHVLTLSSCKWCRFMTDTPSRLKAHFQVHMKTKQMKCNFCDYICFIETDMNEHMTLHENDKLFDKNRETPTDKVCEQEKELTKPAEELDIKDKLLIMDGTDFGPLNLKRLLKRAFFKCSICGEIQNSDDALERHSYKHILQQQYSCHFCNFRGRDKEEIREHLIEHLPIFDLSELDK
ncbi:zinc finger protein 64 [Halyomorpha halys]|uniref:zinc finger protein 64 n=1 Tax=Halyomorpha halys TaxID=286706 RepID=UPI0006D4E487|nr:zinc finger protein 64 [Halyomorpha halys]